MSDVVSGCAEKCGARTIAYPTYMHTNGHGLCNLELSPDECGGPFSFDDALNRIKAGSAAVVKNEE